MSWIALKMLTGDKAKFFGIVMGLTFAALLINQQGSIFCGLMCRTAGQVYDITGADLWVMDANVRYIDDVKPMIENNLYRVRGVEGVLWAVPLYKGQARAKVNSTGIDPQTKQPKRFEVIEQVILLGLDDSAMVGAPAPGRILAGQLKDLRRPDAVMVDFTRLRKLYPGENWAEEGPKSGQEATRIKQPNGSTYNFYRRFLGRELEMNDHRAVIVAVCEATRTFQSNAVVYTKFSRAKLFAPQERKTLSYVLAKADVPPPAEPPASINAWPASLRFLPELAWWYREGKQLDAVRQRKIAEIAGRIADQTGLRARTSQQFIWDTIWYYFQYTGIPINFGITAMLGFLVGTAIAGQTFYNFTLDNIKQFGALKAMGTTNGRIVGMILLQATVVGLLGYGLGVGLAAFFGERTKGGELAFYTPWQLLPITAAAVVLICILSSVLCVRRVVVLEPAVVFRG